MRIGVIIFLFDGETKVKLREFKQCAQGHTDSTALFHRVLLTILICLPAKHGTEWRTLGWVASHSLGQPRVQFAGTYSWDLLQCDELLITRLKCQPK